MTDMEKKTMDSGIEALDDDELEAAAGGAGQSEEDIRKLALSENRGIKGPNDPKFCGCGDAQNIYFQSGLKGRPEGDTVWNAKCYNCGKVRSSFIYPRMTLKN